MPHEVGSGPEAHLRLADAHSIVLAPVVVPKFLPAGAVEETELHTGNIVGRQRQGGLGRNQHRPGGEKTNGSAHAQVGDGDRPRT